MSAPGPAGRKPIRISVGGGGKAGGRKAGKKRKRPAAVAAETSRTAPPPASRSPPTVLSAAAVPALFSSVPRGRSGRSSIENEDTGACGKAEEADEYGSLDILAAMGDQGEDATSDVLLALRSLVLRGAAALCPPPPRPSPPSTSVAPSCFSRSFSPVSFVLRGMLGHALLSTVTAAAVTSASDRTFSGGPNTLTEKEARARADEANRAASAEASTGLEVELARLRRLNRVRVLSLRGTNGGVQEAEGGEVGVMETAEYVRGCREAVEADLMASSPSSSKAAVRAYGAEGPGRLPAEERRAVLEFFVDGLELWTRASVTEEEVGNGLRSAQRRPKREGGSTRCPRVGIRSVVDYLASVGVLLPRRDDGASTSAYWFTLPGMGFAARLIAKGRARVVAKLRFSRYREVKRSVLEIGMVEVEEGRKKGEASIPGMPAAFVVRDLLSRGTVRVQETPAGEFIKLVQPR